MIGNYRPDKPLWLLEQELDDLENRDRLLQANKRQLQWYILFACIASFAIIVLLARIFS